MEKLMARASRTSTGAIPRPWTEALAGLGGTENLEASRRTQKPMLFWLRYHAPWSDNHTSLNHIFRTAPPFNWLISWDVLRRLNQE